MAAWPWPVRVRPRYRLGSRLALSALLDVNVEGERAEQPGQAASHGVSIRFGWQW